MPLKRFQTGIGSVRDLGGRFPPPPRAHLWKHARVAFRGTFLSRQGKHWLGEDEDPWRIEVAPSTCPNCPVDVAWCRCRRCCWWWHFACRELSWHAPCGSRLTICCMGICAVSALALLGSLACCMKCRKYPSRSTGVQSRVYSYIFLHILTIMELVWSSSSPECFR